jgi:hypothetical protein
MKAFGAPTSPLASIVALVLTACGGSNAPASPASTSTPPQGGYRAPPPCRTADDCTARGIDGWKRGDPAAGELLVLACRKGSVEGCLALGEARATGLGGPPDLAGAAEAFERVCRAPGRRACGDDLFSAVGDETCAPDACAWLATHPPAGSDVAVWAARGCSMKGQGSARALRAKACVGEADRLEQAQRPDEARAARELACALGEPGACRVALGERRPPPGPKEATLAMANLVSDGLELRDVSCTVDPNPIVGVIGGMTLAAGFSARKATLRACSSSPQQVEIAWVGDGHRVTELTAKAPDAKVAACVERSLRGSLATAPHLCHAILILPPGP